MTEKVDLEITIPDLKNCSIIQDLEKTKEMIKVLEYIDQPINTKLSSILQVACQYGRDTTVVSYLLEQGANPNYLDIDCRNAMHYARLNEDFDLSMKLLQILKPYIKMHFPINPETRKKQAFDLIKSEIQRHRNESREQQKLVEEFLEKCKELEVNHEK